MSTACLLFALLTAAAAPAPPAQPGPTPVPAEEVTYAIPEGWEKSEKDRIVVLTPPGTSAAKCSLVVTPGEKLEGEFSKWFASRWDALRKGAKVAQGGGRTGKEGPRGSSFLYQAALLESAGEGAEKQTSGLLLYAVHVGDAVYPVVFRTDGPALFNEHKKTVNAFLAGLKFTQTETAEPTPRRKKPAAPATPLKPRPGGAGSRS